MVLIDKEWINPVSTGDMKVKHSKLYRAFIEILDNHRHPLSDRILNDFVSLTVKICPVCFEKPKGICNCIKKQLIIKQGDIIE